VAFDGQEFMTIAPNIGKELFGENRRAVAEAYNEAGERYQKYADGELNRLYAFEGQHSFSDQQTWAAIEERLHHLRLSGARSLRILDLGCGPGTWMRRTVARAHQMGFTDIIARGIDLSDRQIQRAREMSQTLSARADIHLTLEVGDIRQNFREETKSVDLCLCLYGVLNHVAVAELRPLFREIARVTKGWFIATVRTIGSAPTVYVESVSAARRFQQNHLIDQLDVEFQDGRTTTFNSHLFNHVEVECLVRSYLKLEDLRGLDLFHGRFAGDPRWNPSVDPSTAFEKELAALENRYSHDPDFIDHATHMLIVARALRPGG
jgi:SAM-dependent methyltransferase